MAGLYLCNCGFLISDPITKTLVLDDDKARDKLTETKVFPSPFTVEVTKIIFAESFLGKINLILVTNILKASARGETSLTLINSSSFLDNLGISANIGVGVSFSKSCLVTI